MINDRFSKGRRCLYDCTTMLARSVALALVGSAAAFSPMMSMETGRRQVVQAGAAAAVAAPLLKANPAAAKLDQVNPHVIPPPCKTHGARAALRRRATLCPVCPSLRI